MRRALPMLLAILALMIPDEGSAAELGGGGAGNATVALVGESLASTTALEQRGRGGPPQRGRGRGRGGKVDQRSQRGRGKVARSVRRAPRPLVAAPYRAPVRYRPPYRDIRRAYRDTGLSFSVLYSGDWGGVHVDFGRRVPHSVYVVPAPVAVLPPVHLRRPRALRIPPGHLPPPGWCRVWYPGTPPGHQPPPTDCASAYRWAPSDAYIVYGGDR